MSDRLAVNGGRPVRRGHPIPFMQASWDQAEIDAIIQVCRNGAFCTIVEHAMEVRALESLFAARIGVKHAVACSSGTTAQHTSLASAQIGPGDEVIVPSLTFASTAYTVLLQNAIPVFADVDPNTLTIDPCDVMSRVSPRTRAVVPVHWLGRPAEMGSIMAIAAERDLWVIEDCAHGPGIMYNGQQAGTIGHMACWSLQVSKLITSAGEGGLLTTSDDELAERARAIRDHGKTRPVDNDPLGPRYLHTLIGNHYRLTEMQAAFARIQLGKLDAFHERRRECARYYDENLSTVEGLARPLPNPGAELSYAYYPILFPLSSFRVSSVAEIEAAILGEGIETYAIGLDELSHVHPVFTQQAGYGRTTCPWTCPHYDGHPSYGWGTLPVSERVARELLLLPLHAKLTQDDCEQVVAAVKKVADAYRC